jgi:hypothetical protein
MALVFAQEQDAGSLNGYEIIRIGSGSVTRSLLSSMLLAFDDAYRTATVQGSQILRKSLLNAFVSADDNGESTSQLAANLGKNLIILNSRWNNIQIVNMNPGREFIVVEYADGHYDLLGVRRGTRVQTLFEEDDSFVQMLLDA